MCNKVVDTRPSAMQFVAEYYKTQELCDNTVKACPFIFDSFPDQYMIQEMSDKADPLVLKCYLDRHKTQKMCDKVVDAFLATLKFYPDWFVKK